MFHSFQCWKPACNNFNQFSLLNSGRLDTTRKTRRFPHCSWFGMQSWVEFSNLIFSLSHLSAFCNWLFQTHPSKTSLTVLACQKLRNVLASFMLMFRDMLTMQLHSTKSENDENFMIVKFNLHFTSYFCDSFNFPSLQTLGEDLVTVLDYLHVKYVVGLGEGAGWVLNDGNFDSLLNYIVLTVQMCWHDSHWNIHRDVLELFWLIVLDQRRVFLIHSRQSSLAGKAKKLVKELRIFCSIISLVMWVEWIWVDFVSSQDMTW